MGPFHLAAGTWIAGILVVAVLVIIGTLRKHRKFSDHRGLGL
jgi:hypothetical protein